MVIKVIAQLIGFDAGRSAIEASAGNARLED
jgi:hypothetical protein